RYRVQEQRQHLEFERKRVLTLRRLIADISHDLVTPLTSLRLRYDLTRRAEETDRLKATLAALETPLQHLEQQMQSLLTISRLDRDDSQTFNREPHELNALVQQVIEEEKAAYKLKQQ